MKFMLALFSLILLRGCWASADHKIIEVQKNDDTIFKTLNGTYKINTLNNKDVSAYNLNIVFNDSTKQVAGFAGCNRFFGSYSLENNTLKFGALGATKMLCDVKANTMETHFFKALEKANLVVFTKDGFSIYNKKKELLSAIKEETNVNVSFEYSALSRGTYKLIKINQKKVSVINKQNGKPKANACNKNDWQKLIKAFKTFDVKNISNLKAPSKNRFFDGAAIANLKIAYNGVVYESQSFDHGNPPKEIAALVKEILSISKNIE
ncbi:META domain-containing protein [Gelatiniphilus marinus]|uniref:META domain-containing protein n=1 Tax=Gelatiniphilus marinus TaxID=1759464 RepID=A0ABW5JWE8_9FLAO